MNDECSAQRVQANLVLRDKHQATKNELNVYVHKADMTEDSMQDKRKPPSTDFMNWFKPCLKISTQDSRKASHDGQFRNFLHVGSLSNKRCRYLCNDINIQHVCMDSKNVTMFVIIDRVGVGTEIMNLRNRVVVHTRLWNGTPQSCNIAC